MNKSVKFIFNLKRRDHISPYAFKLHFLPIMFRVKFKICLLAYKIMSNISPDYLLEGLEIYQPTTTINLRREGQGRDSFMFKCFPLKSCHNSIFIKLVLYWNGLPFEIRRLKTLGVFKKSWKHICFCKLIQIYVTRALEYSLSIVLVFFSEALSLITLLL